MAPSIRFSANLGFLYTELPLIERVMAAARDGFHAVEFHWPFDTDPAELKAACDDKRLAIVGVNTRRGREAGDFGLAAVPGRETEARELMEEAITYAAKLGAHHVHVMAGKIAPADEFVARETFIGNLNHASSLAAPLSVGLVIEPINTRDAPGYFVSRVGDAAELIEAAALPGIGIMYDLYHAQIMGGDLLATYARYRDLIRHIQFAAVPDRMEPDHGEVDFRWLLPAIAEAGYTGYFGAEYRPRDATGAGTDWISYYRN